MLAAFLLLFVQDPTQAEPVPTETPPPAVEGLDVGITVRASARQIRWRQTGSLSLRAWSEPGGQVIERSLSTGLPRPIPGQRTFNNVGWTLDVGAVIAPPVEAAATPPLPSQTPEPR